MPKSYRSKINIHMLFWGGWVHIGQLTPITPVAYCALLFVLNY